jgi:hypothetical protein
MATGEKVETYPDTPPSEVAVAVCDGLWCPPSADDCTPAGVEGTSVPGMLGKMKLKLGVGLNVNECLMIRSGWVVPVACAADGRVNTVSAQAAPPIATTARAAGERSADDTAGRARWAMDLRGSVGTTWGTPDRSGLGGASYGRRGLQHRPAFAFAANRGRRRGSRRAVHTDAPARKCASR